MRITKTDLLVLLIALVSAGCSGGSADHKSGAEDDQGSKGEHGAEHEYGAHEEDETPRGPHGGRLFQAEDLRFEIAIEEEDGPPEFVAYLADPAGSPLSPEGAVLSVTLGRFANRREVLSFRTAGNQLRSDRPVSEPHSFQAKINLERAGRNYEWSYEQIEGRVDLTPEAMESGGIKTEVAGPRPMNVQIEVPGEVNLNAERLVHVRPRYAGHVTRLLVRLGSQVVSGDTLALVQSFETLVEYAISAPQTGAIVALGVAPGSSVERESAICTVADLSSVWVDFAIYPQHAGRIRKGQNAVVELSSGPSLSAPGVVSYVGPLLEQDTRVSYGRIVISNRDGSWQPGLYVKVRVTEEIVDVPVAVAETAIVRSRFGPAVFVADGDAFELQPVVLGRAAGGYVEVTEGLPAGLPVVVENAFLLKAELGKSEATHDH